MNLRFKNKHLSIKTKKTNSSGYALLAIVLFAGTFAALHITKVQAACAVPTTNFGSATQTISVPTAGTYRVLSRIMAPDSAANSYSLEVDGGSCYTIGDAAIASNTWTWVDYKDGSTATKASINLTAGAHVFKMIGREAGVKLDRIILTTDSACAPSGTGNNCIVLIDTTPPTVSLTAPVTGETISGNKVITATASDASGINRVEFYVGSVLVGSDTTSPYSLTLDTTRYPNGSAVIGAKSYDNAGNSSSTIAKATVTVNNQITTGQPDLVITSVSQTPTSPALNQNVLFSAVVKNQGTMSTKVGTNLGVRFDVDGIVVTWVGNNSDTLLAPGQSVTLVANNGYTGVPYWAATVGAHKILATVDDQNLIAESNETNNTFASSLTVVAPTDTQAPSVPGIVKATATSAKVDVSWTASSDNVGVGGYFVSRNGVTIAWLVGPAVTYTDVNVAPSTAYSYKIAAYDAAGNTSAFNTAVSVTTQPLLIIDFPPSSPTNLTANAVSATQVNLAWTASTDNVGVTGYEVYRATANTAPLKIATVSTTSYGDTYLTAATKYTYYVVARDAAGLISAPSGAAIVTTPQVNPIGYGSISGYVQGKYKHHALPGVLVVIYVNGVRYTYTTNSLGQYKIANLPPNTYKLTFSDALRSPKTYTATVTAGNNTILNVTF